MTLVQLNEIPFYDLSNSIKQVLLFAKHSTALFAAGMPLFTEGVTPMRKMRKPCTATEPVPSKEILRGNFTTDTVTNHCH
jgi:hypothetical protein